MTQLRLNSIAVCHVNQNALDKLEISEVVAEFVGRSDIRRAIFGNGSFEM
jgi:hypothetical protein